MASHGSSQGPPFPSIIEKYRENLSKEDTYKESPYAGIYFALALGVISILVVSACIAADYFSVANALLIKITDKNLDTINRETMARIIQLQDLTKYEPKLQRKITNKVISLYGKNVEFKWTEYEKEVCRKTILNKETSVAQKNIKMFVSLRYQEILNEFMRDASPESRKATAEKTVAEIKYWYSVNEAFLVSIDIDRDKIDKKYQNALVLDEIKAVNQEYTRRDFMNGIPIGLFYARLFIEFSKEFL